jgi:hypothetical protein
LIEYSERIYFQRKAGQASFKLLHDGRMNPDVAIFFMFLAYIGVAATFLAYFFRANNQTAPYKRPSAKSLPRN